MKRRGNPVDPRVRRTHAAVMGAFVRLALDRRYDTISVAELIATSGVGRTTFYEHFGGKDDVLLAVMDPLLVPLANAAAGRAASPHVRMMLSHVWERRAVARVILASATAMKLQRRLAAMIRSRIGDEAAAGGLASIEAAGAAAAQLAMLRCWISEGAPCSPDLLAERLMRRSLIEPSLLRHRTELPNDAMRDITQA